MKTDKGLTTANATVTIIQEVWKSLRVPQKLLDSYEDVRLAIDSISKEKVSFVIHARAKEVPVNSEPRSAGAELRFQSKFQIVPVAGATDEMEINEESILDVQQGLIVALDTFTEQATFHKVMFDMGLSMHSLMQDVIV